MGELTVVKSGLQAQIQDRGRPGLAFYAIPKSGPLDGPSADLANVLLENDPTAPVIECHFVPPTLRFETAATICLTGATMNWMIDGQPVNRFRTLPVSAGSRLSGKVGEDGCRAYIGIRGFLETERTYGSAACCVTAGFGGNGGRTLSAGDRIQWNEIEPLAADVSLDAQTNRKRRSVFGLVLGPEFEWLDQESQHLLFESSFRITTSSNRMGARLSGPVLTTNGRAMAHSVPVLPGMIQLPPSGNPIVVLNDGQTTGGYPRIGYLPQSELNMFNQLRPNVKFRVENERIRRSQ